MAQSAYEKLTPDRFISKLGEDGYPTISGARRAVGRSKWSEPDKKKCHAAINKHFGAEDEPAPVKKQKTGKKAASKPKAEKKKPGRKPKKDSPIAKRIADNAQRKEGKKRGRSVISEEQALVNAAKYAGTISDAIGALQLVKQVDPSIDVKSGMEHCADIMSKIVKVIDDRGVTPLLNGGNNKPATKAVSTPTAVSSFSPPVASSGYDDPDDDGDYAAT